MRHTSLFLTLLLLPATCIGEVFEWTDENGVRNFSSAPSHKDAKRAELPPLTKEERKPKTAQLQSCVGHGGVNCQAGADADGSVICYDGFAQAAARFRFTCSSPKLQVAEVSAARQDGSFSVYIRNETSVKAEGTKVLLKSVEGLAINGAGPSTVEPLAMAEFTFKTSLQPGQKPDAANFETSCMNCG